MLGSPFQRLKSWRISSVPGRFFIRLKIALSSPAARSPAAVEKPEICNVRVQINRDDQGRTQRSADRDGNRIDDSAVQEALAVDTDGRDDAGERAGGANGVKQVALLQPYFMAGIQIRTHGGEALREIFDQPLGFPVIENIDNPSPGDETAMA